MNIQIARCLLGLGVLLSVMGSSVVLPEPLGRVLAQEIEPSAEGLFEAASEQLEAGDVEGALQGLERALKLYQAAGDRVGEMRVLAELGKAYRQNKNYEEALAAFREALDIASQENNLNNIGWLHNEIGIAHFRLKHYEEAAVALENSLAAYQKAKNRPKAAQAFKNLGDTYGKLDKHQKSLDRYLSALSLYAQLENQPKAAAVLRSIGVSYRNLEKPQEAVQALDKSIEIWESLKNYAEVRESLKQLALVQQGLLQQADLADALFERASMTFELEANESDKKEQAEWLQAQNIKLLIDWGQAYQLSGESLYGLELVEQAWEMRQKVGKEASDFFPLLDSVQHSYGTSLNSASITLVRQAKYKEAIDYRGKAYQFVEQSQLPWLKPKIKADQLAGIRLGIATAYQNLENYEKAIENLNQAEKLLKNYPELQEKFHLGTSMVSNYVSLSGQYFESGDFEKAIAASRKAIEISATLKNRDYEVFALSMAGSLHRDMNQFKLAVPLLEKALKISETNQSSSFVKLSSLLLLARVYYSLDQYPKALELFSQASALQEKDGDWLSAARTFSEISDLYSNQGEYKRAYESEEKYLISLRQAQPFYDIKITVDNLDQVCQKPSAFAEGLGFKPIELTCKSQEGLYGSQFQIDNLNDTRSNYLKLLKQSEAEALNSLAILADNLGDIDRSVELMDEAISIATDLNDTHSVVLYKKNLGGIYRGIGDYKKALDMLEKALEIAPLTNDEHLVASALGDLALAYEGMGHYQKGISSIKKSLDIYKELEMQSYVAIALSNLSSFQDRTGDPISAKAGQEKALSIFRELELLSYESSTLSHLGNWYYFQGDFDESLQLHQQAIKLADDIDGLVRVTDARAALAMTYAGQARYADALKEFRKSLEILREIGSKGGEVAILGKIGTLQNSLGQWQDAEKNYQQALAIAQETGAALNASMLQRRIADNLANQERYSEALKIYRDGFAVARDRQIQPEVMHNLQGIGTIQRQQKQWAKAEATLTQALDIAKTTGRRIDQAAILSELGRTQFGQGKTDTAEATLTQALALAQDIRDPQRQAEILSDLGQLYTADSPEMAIALYKQSVNTYETIRSGLLTLDPDTQQSYTNTIADTYRALADLLLTQGRLGEAEQVLELLKIQEIKDFAPTTRSLTQDSDLLLNQTEQELIQKHNSLVALGQKLIDCQSSNSDCSQLKADRRQLTKALNRFLDKLAITIAERCDNVGETQCLEPNNRFTTAAKELVNAQKNTLVISPLVLQDKVWILVASEGGILSRYESSIDRRTLGQTVLKLRQALETPTSDLKQLQTTSKRLYEWLIEPVIQDNPNAENLVFALDRVTRYIPMSVLFDGQQYLTERYAISTVLSPQTTEIAFNTLNKIEDSPVLALGLSEATEGFPALPHVEPELDAIVRESGIYPGQKFLNNDFTIDTLDRYVEEHKIVHLATHAKFVPNQKFSSFLLLGNNKNLPIEDIRTLNFSNVELVVLSACETALGNSEQDGIEIPGLSSFFLDNGADAVMASLWEVEDQSTAMLMQQFYEQLSSDSITKAKAIQQVQQDFLDRKITAADADQLLFRGNGIFQKNAAASQRNSSDFSHPYYWAPFILIGNGL